MSLNEKGAYSIIDKEKKRNKKKQGRTPKNRERPICNIIQIECERRQGWSEECLIMGRVLVITNLLWGVLVSEVA